MKTLSGALSTALGYPVTQPGWLVSIEWPVVSRLSSRGTVSYDGQTWTAAEVDVGSVTLAGLNVGGALRLGNADGAFGALMLSYGVAGVPITIIGYDGAATASADFVPLVVCRAGEADIDVDRCSIALRGPLAGRHSPRARIGQPTFTHLLPAGSTLSINNQSYMVER